MHPQDSPVVYIIVRDRDGHMVAQRFQTEDRVPAWLEQCVGSEGRTCAVYDAPPVQGGRLLGVLARDGRHWKAATPSMTPA